MLKKEIGDIQVNFAQVEALDFVSVFHEAVPEEIAEYFVNSLGRKRSDLFKVAAQRFNDQKKLFVSPKDLENSLISTLASEIWKEVPEDEKKHFLSTEKDNDKDIRSDAYKHFKETLKLLKGDKD